ncbi:MAG: hypothetical protein NVSMB52_18740 [Chloroflexota bacterium]
MGVINVTPDSFSGDGLSAYPGRVLELADAMAEAGADVIDVGGESTRPGSVSVSEEEELSRIVPAIKATVRRNLVPISIDTSKSTVARRALEAGASIVNDVSGLRDPAMAGVVAEFGASLILVHNGHKGVHTRLLPSIEDDLTRQIGYAVSAGVPRIRLIADPGLGMGKDWRANFEVMRELPRLQELQLPLLLGPSRKGMISRVLGGKPDDRLEGTAALVALCIAGGADMIRVHDVRPMRRVAQTIDALVRPILHCR